MDDGPEVLPEHGARPVAQSSLEVFVAHFAAGDFMGALRAASAACHAAPNLPEALYAYGQAWAALGEPRRAAEAFADALRLKPRWADAWVNYGLARYRMNAAADARLAMEQALAVDPAHPAALGNLGAFLRLDGQAERAEALLRDALRAAPLNHGARLNLVADLLQNELAEEALGLLGEVEPPADDPPAAQHWRLQQALAHLQRRDAARARVALETFAALGPTPADLEPLLRWRLVLLGFAEGDAPRARAEARSMEAALEVEDVAVSPEHRLRAHFDLAKFWSGQGEAAAAFRHWRAGHARLRLSQPFSREGHRAFVDAAIAAFPRRRFVEGPIAGNADPTPVFIVGMPRSGTTLCEQILAAHRDAFGAGERLALLRLHRELGGDDAHAPHRIAALGRGALDAAADAYLAELKALAPGAARVVDKLPGNYLHLGLAALMFPNARFIHCARDPRDIGLSIFSFRFHGEHGYAHDLADLGFAISEELRLMDHWRAALPDRVLEVRLEDWVKDFDATLGRVLAHLELPPDPACARFHERDAPVRTASRSQVREPINARGLGRWRHYEDELAPLIAELACAGRLPEAGKEGGGSGGGK